MRRVVDRLRLANRQLYHLDTLAGQTETLLARTEALLNRSETTLKLLQTEESPQFAELRGRLDEVQGRLVVLEQLVDHNKHVQRVLVDRLREALGQIQARQAEGASLGEPPAVFRDVEFKVFSQFNEDGIVQYLLRQVPVPSRRFVEFGVENYEEAVTRFLLMNDNWTGLVFDGDPENIAYLKRTHHYWGNDLKAGAEFVTRENINDLLTRYGMTGDIGLLVVDIDGNDYWVWEAIDAVNPAIVCCEYNWRFGPEASVTVPYDPAFTRQAAHPAMIYFGASLTALCRLAARKGYDFVGCESHGVNAFFVRADLRPPTIPVRTASEGYVAAKVREFRDENGAVVERTAQEQRNLVMELPLVTID
jgi:hypothetical protein